MPGAILVALLHQVRIELLKVLLADLANVDFLAGVPKKFQRPLVSSVGFGSNFATSARYTLTSSSTRYPDGAAAGIGSGLRSGTPEIPGTNSGSRT